MTKSWWGEDVMPRIRWKLMVTGIFIAEGGEIPSGYGIAYYEPHRDVAVCYPLPLNLIIGAWRSFAWHCRVPPWRFTEWRARRIQERAWDAGAFEQARAFRPLPYEANPHRRKRA